MSEEKKEQSTTSESGLDQISLDDENKEELIASDSLDKMMEELKADADGKPQQATQEIEKPVSAAPAEDVKKYKLFLFPIWMKKQSICTACQRRAFIS